MNHIFSNLLNSFKSVLPSRRGAEPRPKEPTVVASTHSFRHDTMESTSSSLLSPSYSERSFRHRGIVFVGPSGVGKGTLIDMAQRHFAEVDLNLSLVVSHTTRKPRGQEQDHVEYHFVSKKEFLGLQEDGAFVESRELPDLGRYYGTSRQAIDDASRLGSVPTFDIDITALKKIKEALPHFDFLAFFVSVPGDTIDDKLEVTKDRLRHRGTESETQIQCRQRNARQVFGEFHQNRHFFDYELVNDDLETTVNRVNDIITTWAFK